VPETSVTVPAERAAIAVTVGAPAEADAEATAVAATAEDTDTGTGTDSGGGREDAPERDPAGGRTDGRRDAGGDGPADGPDGSAYHRGLRRSVLAEVTVGILVLVVTTMLTGTQPGRAATETAAAVAATNRPAASAVVVPFDVGTPGGHGKVQVELAPGRVGENSVQAVIIGPDGGLATVPELRLTFTLESQDLGPIDAEITDKGGYWTSDGLTLPVAGTWTMKVTIRTTDIDQITVSKTVKVD
jgi:copper transport protein